MFIGSFEYIELSSVPVTESCAQVGADDYHERSLLECRVYRSQLERQFPISEELGSDVYYKIKSFPHDFGSYREVVIYYNTDNDAAVEYAYKVEGDLPENWDEEAQKLLGQKLLGVAK